MRNDHANFLKANTGVLVLLIVFVALLVFAHHGYALNEKGFADFCQSKAGEVLAAILLALTAGSRVGISNQREDDPPEKKK